MRRILSLFVAACIAAGCVNTGDNAPSADRSGGADVGHGERPAELAGVAEDSVSGRRLRIALVRSGSYLPDRVALSDQSAIIVSDLLFDGLTEAVAGAGTGSLRPGLALSWSANQSFTVWTFQLDPSAGVSADLVVDALQPLVDGNRAGTAAGATSGFTSVSAVGERTVTIELDAANAGLPWILSGLPYSIVDRSGAATGDYEVASEDEDGLILRRRETPRAQSQSLPDEVTITWASAGEEAKRLLDTGRVDAAVADVHSGSPDASTDTTLSVTATVATRFYVMNVRSAALANPEVRRAILGAVDRARLIRDGFERRVVSVDGVAAPSLSGYEASTCGGLCDVDPGLAAGLTGEVRALPLRVSYTGGDEQEATAEALVAQLVSAGFGATGALLQPEDLAEAIVSGDTDLFAFGWIAPASSIDAVVPPLFAAGSMASIIRVQSAAVTDLLEQAAVTADDGRRWELLELAHRAAMAEALILPVAASPMTLLLTPQVANLSVRADGSLDLESTR